MAMILKDIFQKPVDRPIEGVIKADDEAQLRLEIEEYVLTNEVEKRLEKFLDAYNNYENANGVWVSGFFGSGKSHLLKMLAILLENREIDGAKAFDLFLPKCHDNEILRGDLKRAVSIPSKSILFNIDQKADVISKKEFDALLAVFVKVFDETCGYYGKQGHIAKFERDLDSRGLYQQFMETYETNTGRHWHQGREQALLESSNIAKAYAQVSGDDESAVAGILNKYRDEYRVSIEDFADNIKAYVDAQDKDFRLNFFVDEVGQYIADNVKLMTNLQTIAESLATKCRGRAWVIVTSQNDMSTVLGEMNRQQTNDFSKIQARFNTKMLLTSTNVAEVIQKRLLSKTDDGAETISDLYHQQYNNFGTLFTFADGSKSYKVYKDRDEFIRSYPFVPYQFELFQEAIENLSRHNAFEGKHSSVGERSMLGVFQQVAIRIGEVEIGQLASFDMMYEGIQTALKAQTQSAILSAQRNVSNQFAIKLLKALFLVKYVKGFKPTLHNLCVLMLTGFEQDLGQLRKDVEEALLLLESQTFIQRNGDLYEYLTDEEKDVEEEIKHTEVETDDVADELEKLIFDHVLKNKKIRFDPAGGKDGQDYAFSRKLDDRLHGREYELTINVITPFHEHSDKEDMHRSETTFREELRVLLPEDDRVMRDLMMYKRTDKYIRQNVSTTQQDNVKRILESKANQNRERFADIQQRLKTLLSKAKLFVGGSEFQSGSEDPQTRIVQGFHEVISRTYPNLAMLKGVVYTENDIGKILKDSQESLFGTDISALSESEQDMFAFIQSNDRGGVRVTIKSVLEKFEKKPYGWYNAAMLCTLAKLCARGKIEVRSDGNLLEDDQLEKALKNTHGYGNVVLEPLTEFTASQVRQLKDFFEEFFDAPPQTSEPKLLGKETGEAIKELVTQLDLIKAQSDNFPFVNALQPAIDKLKETGGKPYTWFLAELSREEDTFLDLKEQLIDPIRKFMNGSQKDIYTDARKYIKDQEANFSYIETEEVLQINITLLDAECYKGNKIQGLKTLLDTLKGNVDKKISAIRTQTVNMIQSMQKRMQSMDDYAKLPDVRQNDLNKPYQDLIDHINQQPLIAVINDKMRHFEEDGYQKLLQQMVYWANPTHNENSGSDKTGSGDAGTDSDAGRVKEGAAIYVAAKKVPVDFNKAYLSNEEELDLYLTKLREALLDEINQGKKVTV